MKREASTLFLTLILLGGIAQLFCPVEATQFYNPVASGSADLILINGRIITMNAADSVAEAIAISFGRIVKVGSNADVQSYKTSETKVIDLAGKTVTPGLIDDHGHLWAWGLDELYALDVSPPKVRSKADLLKVLAEKVKTTAKGEWIRSRGMRLLDEEKPSRWDLDTVTPDNPVIVQDMSDHFGIANSFALRLAGITKNTPDPSGGRIVRDAAGEPTGWLVNHAAMDLVRNKAPPFTVQQREESIQHAAKIALSWGYTSVQEAQVWGLTTLEAYVNLANRGELPVRVSMYQRIYAERDIDQFLTMAKPSPSEMLKFSGFKFLLDGVFGAYAGATYEPYGPHGSRGVLYFQPEVLKRMITRIHKAGYQTATHVVGDRAADIALDAIEAALQESPRQDHRHRLEHGCLMRKETLDRMRRLGVVFSSQPAFVYDGGDFEAWLFGVEKASSGMAPIGTMLRMGIPVALGTDVPTTPTCEPWMVVWAAVTRKTVRGRVLGEQERITVKEAFRQFTIGTAYAAFEEKIKGSVEEGKLADLVVWSDDPYSIPIDKIKELRPQTVILGGRIVYVSPVTTTTDVSIRTISEVSTMTHTPGAPTGSIWFVILIAVVVPVAVVLLWLRRRARRTG